ncbi:hypothetical protein [Brevibacillus borstelensis]|uniref:hypothetical protein n=1 Tax=Brevibacillus borstelensis TaxID=45462 RepID=UPI0030BE5801
MPFLIIFLSAMLTGCTLANNSPEQLRTNAVLQSDRSMYYQQNVILPPGMEPNATPYGTPANSGTAGEYGRTLRRDAVSHYPGWD